MSVKRSTETGHPPETVQGVHYLTGDNTMKTQYTLECSRGCKYDTNQPWWRHLQAGDRCPGILSYDIINGTRTCRRILRPIAKEHGDAHPRI